MSAKLSDLQDQFQARLLRNDNAINPHLGGGGPFMKVYDYAYRARLVEILQEEFESLHTLLGDEQFYEAMYAYVDSHPSRNRSARWLGEHLADWLGATEPWSNIPVATAMARFEWMVSLAFDAPDADLLAIEDMGAVPPEAWPMLTFTFHPALNTAELSHDVSAFYRAVSAEEDPDAAPELYEQPQTWVAWRDPESFKVTYRALGVEEKHALAAARDGMTFDGFCEVVADHTDAEEAAVHAAGLLRIWIESGWIIGLDAEGMSW